MKFVDKFLDEFLRERNSLYLRNTENLLPSGVANGSKVTVYANSGGIFSPQKDITATKLDARSFRSFVRVYSQRKIFSKISSNKNWKFIAIAVRILLSKKIS